MRKRLAVVAVAAVFATGLGCDQGVDPQAGLWDELGLQLPADVPLDALDLDADALFELINLGGGEIDLGGLGENVPGAIQDLIAAELGDAVDLGGLLGTGDVAGLISELESLLDLLSSGLGGLFSFLFDPLLDFFGLGSLGELEDLLNDVLDSSGLLAGLPDLQGLLDELNGLPGTIPAGHDLECSLSGSGIACDTLTHVIDVTPAADAVIDLSIDVTGVFAGPTSVTLHVTVDAACTGADCAEVLGLTGLTFPFTYSVMGGI